MLDLSSFVKSLFKSTVKSLWKMFTPITSTKIKQTEKISKIIHQNKEITEEKDIANILI